MVRFGHVVQEIQDNSVPVRLYHSLRPPTSGQVAAGLILRQGSIMWLGKKQMAGMVGGQTLMGSWGLVILVIECHPHLWEAPLICSFLQQVQHSYVWPTVMLALQGLVFLMSKLRLRGVRHL